MIGKSLQRVDAWSKVRGEALYPGDISLPGQAYLKVLTAGRPHAVIRRVDTSAVEHLAGVLAVLTARDVPVNAYGYVVADQSVLCGPGTASPEADRVRYVGDRIALVIAETEAIAAEAVSRIEVTFEDLPIVTDAEAAMGPDAPRLHGERERNVLSEIHIAKGDTANVLGAAEIIVEGEYRTPTQEHAFLQPEAGVAYIDPQGRLTVHVAGQWLHKDQRQVAHALGLPEEQVRVVYPAIGGSFGGREDISIQIILGLAAWRLAERGIPRPVKLVWSREESILGHAKRHPYLMRARWGATREGRVIAAECQIIQDAGAYAFTSTKILPTTALMVTGPYDIPNVKVDGYSVYTNNIPNGAFRGFGAPQGCFVAETQMDRLAHRLGIDPIRIRQMNLLPRGGMLSVNSPLPEGGEPLERVLTHCATSAGWRAEGTSWRRPATAATGPTAQRRGTGIALAFKNVGFSWGAPESCAATIELRGETEIDRVILRTGAADVGQGAHTVLQQMAAAALGVPPHCVTVFAEDSSTTPDAGSSSASRLTFMTGNAVHEAARLAMEKWRLEERPAIASVVYHPPKTTAYDPALGTATPYIAYGYVAEAVTLEVDEQTGRIRLLEVVCADDVGRAINPQQVRAQIEGALVQAAGYSLIEDFRQQDGQVMTPSLSTYLIPTALDIPDELKIVVVENPTPLNPWGARGVGEMPFVPLAPAVISAVHDATGVWFNEFPLTPERVWRGLRQQRIAAAQPSQRPE